MRFAVFGASHGVQIFQTLSELSGAACVAAPGFSPHSFSPTA
jgi:hypothetical protein